MEEQFLKLMSLAFSAGYQRGHEDTVEGQFVNVHPSDQKTFFRDEVIEILDSEIFREEKLNLQKYK
jgi:hypothetical protein